MTLLYQLDAVTGERGYVQVKGVEEEDDVFALVVGQGDLFHVAVDNRHPLPLGGGLRDVQLRHGCVLPTDK